MRKKYLSKKEIKNLSSKEYNENRDKIRTMLKKERELYQAKANKNLREIKDFDLLNHPHYDIERKFINKINQIYWANRSKSEYMPESFTNKPWLKHKKNAKSRCEYKKDKKYKYYGGRGIKYLIAEHDLKMLWIRDKAYLMIQPSIHRKDSKKHYTYENCEFIELKKHKKNL